MCRYVTIAVALSMVLPPSAMASRHLVDRAEMVARLRAAEAERASNQLKVERFLSSRISSSAQSVDTQRLSAVLAALSDDELRDLASRADSLQTDPVAGGRRKTLP